MKTYASPKRGSGNGDDASGESFDEAMTELMQQVARMRAANGGSTQADTLLGRSVSRVAFSVRLRVAPAPSLTFVCRALQGFSSADVDDPCLDYSSAWDYLHVMADIAAGVNCSRVGVAARFNPPNAGDGKTAHRDHVPPRADGRRSAEQLWFEDLREIWVILFEDLRSGVDEGIYSVKGRNLDTQDAVDVVVAFEGRDDAARAACLIEARAPGRLCAAVAAAKRCPLPTARRYCSQSPCA